MDLRNIISFVLFAVITILTFVLGFSKTKKKEFNIVRFIARVSIFGALSSILYVVPIFKIKLPFFPSFLDLHFDEIPAFICGFAYGPLSAFAVILIKTIIKLPFTTSLTVGEICDLVLSSAYIIPACLIYQKKRNLKGVFIGMGVATALQIIAGVLLNVYAIVPFYINMMGMTEEQLLYVMRLAIPAIKNVQWSYGLLAIMPFNLLKDILVFVLTFVIYRKIHFLLRYDGRKGLKKTD